MLMKTLCQVSLILVMSLELCIFVGCCTTDAGPGLPAPVALATQEVTKRLGWRRYRVEYVRPEGDGWRTMKWSLPETPGGFVVVDIAKDGNISAIHPGE